MDKELFEFLMQETNYTQDELQAVYNMDKQGKEIADKINKIYETRPSSLCHVALNKNCSRCPIKRVQENLDVRISLSCDDVFIILGLLKEENK